MSHVGRVPVAADDEAPSTDDPCSQAGADTQINEILQALAGSKVHLAQSAQICILLNPYRKFAANAGRDFLDKVHLGPSKVDDIVDHSLVRIHLARAANSDPHYISGTLTGKIQDLTCHPIKDSLHPFFALRKHLRGCDKFT